jgi:hypothetical protein
MATITKADLFNLAKSGKPEESKRAFEMYQAWLKAAPKLDPKDRITAIERMLLDQIFRPKKPPRK